MIDTSGELIEKLIERLGAGDAVGRRNAAGALRLNGTRAAKAIPALTRLLADQDDRVRGEARRALEAIRRAVA